MAVQIPSFIQNAPHGSNPNAPTSSDSSSNPKNNMLRNILFIIAILLIGGGAVYYFMFYQKDDVTNENTNLVVATNINKNTNINTNSNQNSNSHLNTNIKLNTNTTSNLNSTLNVNTINNNNVNTSLNTNLNAPSVIDNGDIDGDGLTNNDEYLYGTDDSLIDSDGDGYNDYTEVMSCYNPNGSGYLGIDDYNSYCYKLVDQNSSDWGITDYNEISDICKIYLPVAQISIDYATTDTTPSQEGDFNIILDNQCNKLKDTLELDELDEEIICSFMSSSAMLCFNY